MDDMDLIPADGSLLDAYEWATSGCLCSRTYTLSDVGRVVIHKSCDRFLIHAHVDGCHIVSLTSSVETVLLVHAVMNDNDRRRHMILLPVLVTACLFAPWLIGAGVIGLMFYVCLTHQCQSYAHRADSSHTPLDLFNIRHRVLTGRYPSWLIHLKEMKMEKKK
jgi:hypothetical protein